MKDLTGYRTPREFARDKGCSYTYIIDLIRSDTLPHIVLPTRGQKVFYMLPPEADHAYDNRPMLPSTYRKEMSK